MINLKNTRPWEKVLLVIKRHWIVYVILWLYFLLLIISTIIIFAFLNFQTISYISAISLWLIFSLFLYVEWLNHELDMYVVTNNRIIWIEQISFLNRTVSECNLWQVQEVNSKTSWLFANIFNYGTLSIQTAWSVTTLKMWLCPNAIEKARKVLNIVDNYRDNQWKKQWWENKNTKEDIKE